MGKLLKKVVASRLTYFISQYNLILDSQFEDRANSFTSDTIIKGYFDFVNHKCLFNEIKKCYIPLKLVKWTANFSLN